MPKVGSVDITRYKLGAESISCVLHSLQMCVLKIKAFWKKCQYYYCKYKIRDWKSTARALFTKICHLPTTLICSVSLLNVAFYYTQNFTQVQNIANILQDYRNLTLREEESVIFLRQL